MQVTILLFTNQHIAKRSAKFRGKPAMRREVLSKVAGAPGKDAVFKTRMGRAGMQKQRVEFLKSKLLIAADDFSLGVGLREIVMEPASITIGHDAFLILGARSVESSGHHRIVWIEYLLRIDGQHIVPILTTWDVQSGRNVSTSISGSFL